MADKNNELDEEKIQEIGDDINGDEKIEVLMSGKLPDRYDHLDLTDEELKKISRAMRDPVNKPLEELFEED